LLPTKGIALGRGEQKKGKVFDTGFGLMAELLSFASPKESNQRKGEPKAVPYGVPCATRDARGRAQTRFAQTSARPDPHAAALLSTA
jgi:hypothetical protein